MSGKCRPCLRRKTLCNVWFSELSNTDKDCITQVFDRFEEQQAEIERYKNRQKPTGASGYKVENGKVVFFTDMLGGCKVVKENLEEVVKTLNELLQEAYAKDEIAFALKCKTEELKTAKAEAVKEFAERIEQSDVSESDKFIMVRKYKFDNLVKEMVGDADGR